MKLAQLKEIHNAVVTLHTRFPLPPATLLQLHRVAAEIEPRILALDADVVRLRDETQARIAAAQKALEATIADEQQKLNAEVSKLLETEVEASIPDLPESVFIGENTTPDLLAVLKPLLPFVK